MTIFVLGLFPILLFIGWAYQIIQSWSDARQYPPSGRLVDVGEYRLHLNCIGDGSPTVILESSHGGTWMDWVLVQPEVAKFTRVCSYDRAGMGWSDAGQPPRTSSHIAGELHRLLSNAGEHPPYVLVGHSIGGHHVRMFANLYPEEVSGIVLVDAAHEEMFQRLSPQVVQQVESLAKMIRWIRYSMYFGIPRLLGLCGQVPEGFEHLKGEQMFNQCRASFIRTLEQELDAVKADGIEVARIQGLGSLPLVVVSRDFTIPDPGFSAEVSKKDQAAGKEMQQELAELSSAGKFVMAEGSGHYVQLDRPDLVIQAIREITQASQ